MKKILTLVCLSLLCALTLPAQTRLIAFGSKWQYLDNGKDQGTAWQEPSFNDSSWKSGDGLLGYGNGNEKKTVGYGGDEDDKHITTYFRKKVTVDDASVFTSYRVSLKRDDGAVVYINGKEVYRTNMPGGAVTYLTKANAHAEKNGSTAVKKTLTAGTLLSGTNVIAVEIHQASRSSADIAFDLELTATADGTSGGGDGGDGGGGDGEGGGTTQPDAELTRGPYLQMGNDTAVSLRWRTDDPTDSRIEVGLTDSTYTLSAVNPKITTEHEVRITGLKPDTKYYYRFGSSKFILDGDKNNFFRTAPPTGSNRKVRFAFFGDCGKNDNGNQTGTLNAYLNYTGDNPAELMLIQGDLAYMDGKDAEFQKNFFNVYSPNLLKNHVLFSVPGNHDYHTTTATSRSAPYFKNFSMPVNGECGGVPSNSKSFYSFDWGNVHFLCLDTYGIEADGTRVFDTLGIQAKWIKKDLEANKQEWVIVMLHHPPFSKGNHDSDEENAMIAIRLKLVPLLERYGVDAVIGAHSHNYERSYLLNGYYGTEASFKASTHSLLSASSGKYDGSANSCPFITPSGKVKKGVVYVVSGSAGAAGNVSDDFPHKALPFAFDDGGMFFLEVEGNRLDGKFLRKNGKISDQFTIIHDANVSKRLPLASGGTSKLQASWRGDFRWSTGETSRSIIVDPSVTTTYTVTDERGCLSDEFTVVVPERGTAGAMRPEMEADAQSAAGALKVYPTLVRHGHRITIQGGSNEQLEMDLLDENGRVLRSVKFAGVTTISTGRLPAGTYFLRTRTTGHAAVHRFVVVK